MEKTFEERRAEIPDDLWELTKGGLPRFSSDEDILYYAELAINRNKGYKVKKKSEKAIKWQVFLTVQQTRIILEALKEYETVIEDDLVELNKLIEWFESQLEF